jgi:hypothetical protein
MTGCARISFSQGLTSSLTVMLLTVEQAVMKEQVASVNILIIVRALLYVE